MTLATHASVGLPTGLTSIPGVLALVSDCPRGRPDIFGDSGPWPGSCGVYQLSRAHSAQARVPAVSTHSPKRVEFGSKGPRSTCCPGRLGPGPDVPPGLPGVPGDSGSGRRVAVLPSHPGSLGPGSEGPRCHTALLGHSRFGPTDRGVDQLTRATLARCPKALGVDRLSRASPACARGTVVWTNSPRRLKFGSEVPQPTCFPG